MARLFADENLPRQTVEELRRLGHDVLTMQELGKASQRVSDSEVLDLAIQENRVVLTLNRRDFRRLHQSRPGHSGIVACTFDPDHKALAIRIDDVITKQGDLHHRLALVYRPSR